MKRLLLMILLALSVLTFCAGAETTENTSGFYRYILLEDGSAMITGYDGLEETLAIPAAVDGHTVTAIDEGAFYSCTSLETVTIPQGVQTIGDFAFEACTTLTTVHIPQSITELGANPFLSCSALRYIVLPSEHPTLAVVDGVLYSRTDNRLICYPLAMAAQRFSVPQGTEAIGAFAFYHAKVLQEISLSGSVMTLDESAFEGCSALEKIALPEGVTAIGPRAFAWCTALTGLRLPETLQEIGAEAFLFSRSLTRVTLPDDVQTIGEDAFSWCPKVQLAAKPGTAAAQWALAQGLTVIGK